MKYIETVAFPGLFPPRSLLRIKISGFVTLYLDVLEISLIFFFVQPFLILQLVSMQKELQKQMNVMVSVPVTKEGKRLEGSLGRGLGHWLIR